MASSLVAVVSRHLMDQGGSALYVVDILACGHQIWHAVASGWTYPVAERRRCPTCDGTAIPGEPVIRRHAPR